MLEDINLLNKFEYFTKLIFDFGLKDTLVHTQKNTCPGNKWL